MSTVTVRVPSSLRQYWGGGREAHVEAATLRDAIAALGPLATRILDERGAQRPHVSLFVNGALAKRLDAELHGGDVVHVLPAVSGGHT